MSKEAKQVIVVRTKYPDKINGLRKIRTGKLMAQACHASTSWLAGLVRSIIENDKKPNLNEFENQWVFGRFKKICVGVSSEGELQEIYEKAKNAGLNVSKIVDAGLTEFGGEATLTCVGIGPNDPDEIDKITGGLPLL